jgi:hypothetical protein
MMRGGPWRVDSAKRGVIRAAFSAALSHPICVVADGRRIFPSSDNLTEYALSINRELGVLITDGSPPSQVEAHFASMIESESLVKA